ncbi:L-glutamine kinase [Actinosynnema sp. ALI-1.44]
MGKAEMLGLLSSSAAGYHVPRFTTLNADAWQEDAPGQLARVRRDLPGCVHVAVRSSAVDEDTTDDSAAGKYTTVLDVPLEDDDAVSSAVDRVVDDMFCKSPVRGGHVVIVQEMVGEPRVAGVATTVDAATGAPYFIVSYEATEQTDSVTAGYTVPRFLAIPDWAWRCTAPDGLSPALAAVREVRDRVGHPAVEVEFAIDRGGRVHVLQVRPIVRNPVEPHGHGGIVRRKVTALRRLRQHAALLLSDMADWNPAEMLGEAPRPLAYSLYREFITRETWRRARGALGYHEPLGRELMFRVGGRPYVDVRASLASLVPASVPASLREKLVDIGVERVRASPESHDSIEFDAAVSHAGLDTERSLHAVYGDSLSARERHQVRRHLVPLSNRLTGVAAIDELVGLEQWLSGVEVDATWAESRRDPAAWFRSDAFRRLSAELPLRFAIAARHGFLAHSFLTEMQSLDILDGDRVAELRRTIRTVATDFLDAAAHAADGTLDAESFRLKYGHLRPGTYDVRSAAYATHTRIPWSGSPRATAPEFRLTRGEAGALTQAIRRSELDIGADYLIEYVRCAVRLREYAKFVYSKLVSATLGAVAALGRPAGLTTDDLSFLTLPDVLRAARGEGPAFLVRRAARRSEHHRRQCTVVTPSVIRDPDDLLLVIERDGRPTFVTDHVVRSRVEILTDLDGPTRDVAGAIVCVERADPGYDWLLAAGVAGLITRFGGPNSHLAVRCAELRVPAAIGCGQAVYRRVAGHHEVELDCSSRQIRPMRPRVRGWS